MGWVESTDDQPGRETVGLGAHVEPADSPRVWTTRRQPGPRWSMSNVQRPPATPAASLEPMPGRRRRRLRTPSLRPPRSARPRHRRHPATSQQQRPPPPRSPDRGRWQHQRQPPPRHSPTLRMRRRPSLTRGPGSLQRTDVTGPPGPAGSAPRRPVRPDRARAPRSPASPTPRHPSPSCVPRPARRSLPTARPDPCAPQHPRRPSPGTTVHRMIRSSPGPPPCRARPPATDPSATSARIRGPIAKTAPNRSPS